MATGKTPFAFSSWKELSSVLNEKYLKKYAFDPSLPESLTHLLRKIFVFDKNERISIDKILNHSFFTGEPLEKEIEKI